MDSSTCLVPGCNYKRETFETIIYYLPQNIERRSAWLTSIGRPELIEAPRKGGPRYYVCGKHFGYESFTNNLRLKANAIPQAIHQNKKRITEEDHEENLRSYVRNFANCIRSIFPKKENRSGPIGVTRSVPNNDDETTSPLNMLRYFSSQDNVNISHFLNMFYTEYYKIHMHKVDFQLFALNVYGNNPSEYGNLRDIFQWLPALEELKLFNPTINPGFDDNILRMLYFKVSRLRDDAKIVSLCLDVITLKQNIQYDFEDDRLHGFEENGLQVTYSKAKYLVVGMLRGLYKNIILPVGYVVIATPPYYDEVSQWIESIIRNMLLIGFDVRAIVSSLDPFLINTLKCTDDLNKEPMYIQIDEKKIYYIFDVFSVLEAANKTFKQCDLLHSQREIAKWQHIIELYQIEKDKKTKLVPKLNESSLNCDYFDVFSSNVVTALSLYSEIGIMEENVIETANFITTICNLRDFLISNDCEDEENDLPIKKLYRGTKDQLSILTDMATFLGKLKVIYGIENDFDDSDTKDYFLNPLRFIKAFLTNINSIKNLFLELKADKYDYLCTRNLSNQFIKDVYKISAKQPNLTCYEFNRVFRDVFVKNMLEYHQYQESFIVSDLPSIQRCINEANVFCPKNCVQDEMDKRNILCVNDAQYYDHLDPENNIRLTDQCSNHYKYYKDFVKYLIKSAKNSDFKLVDAKNRLKNLICKFNPGDDYTLVDQIFQSYSTISPECSVVGTGAAMLNLYVSRCKYKTPCACFPLLPIFKLCVRIRINEYIKLQLGSDQQLNAE